LAFYPPPGGPLLYQLSPESAHEFCSGHTRRSAVTGWLGRTVAGRLGAWPITGPPPTPGRLPIVGSPPAEGLPPITGRSGTGNAPIPGRPPGSCARCRRTIELRSKHPDALLRQIVETEACLDRLEVEDLAPPPEEPPSRSAEAVARLRAICENGCQHTGTPCFPDETMFPRPLLLSGRIACSGKRQELVRQWERMLSDASCWCFPCWGEVLDGCHSSEDRSSSVP